MVMKKKGIFFLNRKECVDYLMEAYDLKWCITSWRNDKIKISYQSKNSVRNYFFANAYKVNGSKVIHLSQKDLDAGMMS